MERIYHNYEKWECYKNGFYKSVSTKEKEEMKFKVLEFFRDERLTNKYMNKVINEWTYSCEHFMTNPSMNKIAYLGQAACCLCFGIPNQATMYGWKFLSVDIQLRSNKIALENIRLWKSKQRLKDTLNNGSKKDIQTEYQTRLHLN